MKRLISCDTSDLEGRTRQELLGALEASEGRVIVQELSLFRDAAMLEPITDAEIACAFGADLILLNAFDCVNPHIAGITAPADQTIRTLKRYTGRLIGLNLEPVGTSETLGELEAMPEGRAGTVENALRARDLGRPRGCRPGPRPRRGEPGEHRRDRALQGQGPYRQDAEEGRHRPERGPQEHVPRGKGPHRRRRHHPAQAGGLLLT